MANRLSGSMVDILVGPQLERFGVHEKLIRESSPFLNKAMSGEWRESSEDAVKLPEDEPEIFGVYVHWLYYGTMPVIGNSPFLEYLNLAKGYILGDKLLDTRYQDATIHAIIERSVTPHEDKLWYPLTSTIEHAYNNTGESAKIRKLLVDLYVFAGQGNWLNPKNASSVPQPFLFELSSKLLDLRSGNGPKVEASNYCIHIQVSGEQCLRAKVPKSRYFKKWCTASFNIPSLTNPFQVMIDHVHWHVYICPRVGGT